MIDARGGERVDQRVPELLGFGIELLVVPRPLPRGRVRHGDRRRRFGGGDGGDHQSNRV